MLMASSFDRDELENSMPFNLRRTLRGDLAESLKADLKARLEAREPRRRARKPEDEQRLVAALDALLANLAAAALNRVDPRRFVAVGFGNDRYVDERTSGTALRAVRDFLLAEGLIDHVGGFQARYDAATAPFPGATGVKASRLTRVRARPQLASALLRVGGWDALGWMGERRLIVLNEPAPGADPAAEPEDVRASRQVLRRVNKRIAATRIELPEDAWVRVARRYTMADAQAGDRDERQDAGDTSAVALFRAFKGDWGRGGRIYGGWWMNVPKAERPHLTLNGEPTVELDYGRLHPTLLFHRAGRVLDFDLYAVPGYDGPLARDLGKRTFNRLLNKTSRDGVSTTKLTETELDRAQLPPGASFREYVEAFVRHAGPIKSWFGTGEGVRLQREDSELALEVLSRLDDEGVTALPIHDSFIVASLDEHLLRTTMTTVFMDKYGFAPVVGG